MGTAANLPLCFFVSDNMSPLSFVMIQEILHSEIHLPKISNFLLFVCRLNEYFSKSSDDSFHPLYITHVENKLPFMGMIGHLPLPPDATCCTLTLIISFWKMVLASSYKTLVRRYKKAGCHEPETRYVNQTNSKCSKCTTKYNTPPVIILIHPTSFEC